MQWIESNGIDEKGCPWSGIRFDGWADRISGSPAVVPRGRDGLECTADGNSRRLLAEFWWVISVVRTSVSGPSAASAAMVVAMIDQLGSYQRFFTGFWLDSNYSGSGSSQVYRRLFSPRASSGFAAAIG